MKLLIIDDHAGIRSMIREVATLPGDEVLECSSGEEALSVIEDFAPDWVSVDIRMGGMSGLAVVRAIRLLVPGTRSVIVSSYDVRELRAQANEAGATAYMLKDNLYELRDLFHQGQPV